MSVPGALPAARAMREFYAAEPDEDIESLADKLAAVKRRAVVPGLEERLGELSGRQVIVAEGVHAGIFKTADSIPFQTDKDEAHEIVRAVRQDALLIAHAAILTGAKMQAIRDRHVAYHKCAPIPRRVMAGMVLASVAYEGMKRKSGRPYFDHPDEIVSILRVVWRMRNPPDQKLIHQDTLESATFVAYLHDAFEDAYSKKTQTYLNNDVVVSPLVAGTTLNYLHHGNKSQELSRALWLLTHPVGVDDAGRPRKSSYEAYIERGSQSPMASHWFELIKIADNQHNLVIEPKVPESEAELERIDAKELRYVDTQNAIREHVGETYDSSLLRNVILLIPSVTRAQVQNEKKRQPSIVRNEATKTFREVLGELRAA